MPEIKMLQQLEKETGSKKTAKKYLKEIFESSYNKFKDSHTPKTVGEYYNKFIKTKN